MLKKGILFIFAVFLYAQSFAQPVNNNNANPYGTHPYETNPYSDQNNTNDNFLKEQEEKKEEPKNKAVDEKREKNNSKTDKKSTELDFKDLNSKEDEYTNDPDYLKYVGAPNSESIPEEEDSLTNRFFDLDKNKIKKTDSSFDLKSSIRNKVYGANFFRNNVFELSDKLTTTPPLDYRLGPGDEILVSIWGDAELNVSFKLAGDGSIFPKNVGKIRLNGLTFDEASQLITSRFRKVIPSKSNIDVQMGRSRLIRVTIEGEVEKPGTYSISAFNSALNALFKAGGLTELGNLRKIEVKRQGRTVEIIDLYEYLQKAKSAEEVYLEDNDYIFVDVYDKLVQAQGSFKRPMYYQLTADEALYDLVFLAGGPAFNARSSQVQIKTIVNEEEHYINIPGFEVMDKHSSADVVLKDGDVVTLKPVNTGLRNVVKIDGAINYPDEYEIRNGEKLLDIVEKAGGLKPEVYLAKAFVFRGQNQLESNALKVDLRDIHSNDPNNIVLQRGDRIKILSQNNFEEKFKITVRGYVRKPGDFPYANNLKLKDLLLLAGGLSLDAENGRIEIANIVDSLDKYSMTNRNNGSNIKIVSINANLEIDEASENIMIKPMDRIYVRRKAEILAQKKMMVLGEVSYPGEYVFNKNERLASLVTRAGGLNSNAYAGGAKLYRKGTGVIVIDLPNALGYPNSKYDVTLSDSDVLIIPIMNDIVSIKGEVQNQVNVKFDKDNQNLKHYIASAGGFGDNPWKSRINVKYQSGKIKSTKSFLGFRVFPKIKEGCTITIPQKPEKQSKVKFQEILTYTLSTLTTMATLVLLAKSLNP